jgi:CRP-like cAMP-binding protein
MTPRPKDIDLGDIWLFSALSASQLRTLRKTVDEVTVPAGRVLCEEGSVGREFFFIVDGTASVRRNGRKATVVSDTEMTLLVLEQRRFNGLLEAMPALAHKLLVAMSERLREADTRAVN